MIADLKPYPEYKESGLPWLAQVPGHWDLIPNRGLVHRRKVLVGKRHGDYRLLSLTKQGVIVRDISTGKGKFSSDMGTSQEVRNGDLVFCLFDVPETPRTVGLSQYEGMITGAYTVFESLGRCSSEYFELFYRAMDDRKLLSPLYSGLRHTIPVERFLGTKTPHPPPSEQAAIVRFLDYANGRLERAIRAKRKVIALLHEQKQAIIHRAVTRGLDPTVPLKPSGIPWLGEIPRHWEVLPLGRVLKERIEQNDPIKTDNILSLSLHDGVIPYAEKRAGGNKAKDDLTAYKLAYPGDIVINSMNVVVGSVGLSKYFGAVSPVYYMLRPRNAIDAVEFFDALFHDPAFQRSLFGLGNGIMFIQSRATGKLNTIRMRIPMGKLNRVDIPHPPSNEQASIVQRIRAETARLDTSIARLEREISLLREYRTRLVADVVTGKLDVRAVAARLPEEKNEWVDSDASGLSDPSDDSTRDDEPTPEDAS